METSSLTFASPLWFIALAVIPVVAGLYIWSQRRSDRLIAKVVAPRLRSQLAGAVSRGRRIFKAILMMLVFAFLVIALARPQMGYVEQEIKQTGRDVIFAIDTSRSMLATDVTPTRLARAKLAAQDLMNLVHGDRIGLIAFAGSAFLQAPLTLDYNAVLNSLDELDTNIIPKGGTDIAAAIDTAIEAFGKGEGKTRALIILTDGEELDANGIAAAKKAGALGIRIFTVGVGSAEGSLIPIRTEGGGADFVRDQNNKPVQSRLDAARLKEIAEAAGGFYLPLGPDVAQTIFEKGIVPIDKTEAGIMTSRKPIERYEWPLSAALILLGLWFMLGDRRRLPAPSSRRPAALAAAIGLLALSVSGAFAANGLEEYQAGNYEKAKTDFERQLQKSPDSDKLQFDAGAASYKAGDYAKAVDYFTKALLTDEKDLRENAAYNLGNALVRQGEAAKGNDEKKADWKNAIQHYTETLNLNPKNKEAEENRNIVKKLLEDLDKQEKQKQQQQQKKDQKQDQKDQKNQQNPQQQQKSGQNQKDQNQPQNQGQQKDQQNQSGQQDQAKNQQNNQNKDQQSQNQQGQGGKDQQQQQQGTQPKPGEQKKDQSGSGQNQEKKDEQKPQDQNPQNGNGSQDQKRQEMAQNDAGQNGNQQKSQPNPQPTPGEKKQGDLKTAGDKQDQQPAGQQKEGQQVAEGEQEKDGEMTAAQAKNLLNSLRGEEERVRMMQKQDNQETLKDW